MRRRFPWRGRTAAASFDQARYAAEHSIVCRPDDKTHRCFDRRAGQSALICGGVSFYCPNRSCISWAMSLRSILPFGLRGRLPPCVLMSERTMNAGRRRRHSASSLSRSSKCRGSSLTPTRPSRLPPCRDAAGRTRERREADHHRQPEVLPREYGTAGSIRDIAAG